jgi:hypothetical protein
MGMTDDPTAESQLHGHPTIRFAEAGRTSGPSRDDVGCGDWATDRATADSFPSVGPGGAAPDRNDRINAAAVAAYCASIQAARHCLNAS